MVCIEIEAKVLYDLMYIISLNPSFANTIYNPMKTTEILKQSKQTREKIPKKAY